MKPRISPQMIKFGMIGVANTAVDFALFHLLANEVGLPFYIANVFSTASALTMSFILNAKFAFDSRVTRRNAVLFVSVTLAGLWVLQPLIIALVRPLLDMTLATPMSELTLLAAKAVATVASLTWNYFLYKNVVFKKQQ
jgi:putative flippase GtrA